MRASELELASELGGLTRRELLDLEHTCDLLSELYLPLGFEPDQ